MSVDQHRDQVDYRHRTARFYRAHLQQVLVQHLDMSSIHFSKAFQSVSWDGDTRKLVITFANGTTATADLLLGADGIHSAVRTFFVPTSHTSWTGGVAFRSVFPLSHMAHIPDLPDEANHFWGPDRTLFVSKLGRGLFTVVASSQIDPDASDAPYKDAAWDSDGAVAMLRQYYHDWSPLARSIVDATPYTRIYPNVAAHGLETWVLGGGRATLAGDAAHAHGGAFAAGGSLAIDDAWAFAAALLQVFPTTATQLPSDAELLAALQLYERTRKAHTDKIIRLVHTGNRKRAVRAAAPALETDEELRARMKSRADTSWIHEHDVEQAFASSLALGLGDAEEVGGVHNYLD